MNKIQTFVLCRFILTPMLASGIEYEGRQVKDASGAAGALSPGRPEKLPKGKS